jgi:hypothetical protein
MSAYIAVCARIGQHHFDFFFQENNEALENLIGALELMASMLRKPSAFSQVSTL